MQRRVNIALHDGRGSLGLDYVLMPLAAIDNSMPVIDLPDARPFATGDGPHDYLCGTCRNVLLSKVEIFEPQRVTVICGKCRTANLMQASPGDKPVSEP